MKNNIIVLGRADNKLKTYAKEVAFNCLKFMNQPTDLEVVIEFVSEAEIKRLNNELRGIDRVTDVLSFPATNLKVGDFFDKNNEQVVFENDGAFHFGDMALCIKRLREQAKEFGETPKQELKKLVIHSMLHLMGYDHIKDSDYEIMNKKEIEMDRLIK